LFRGAERVVVARGKQSLEFDLRRAPDWEALASAALGPSGNLRAPAVRLGTTWLVGFGEEAWRAHLG